MRQCMCCVFVYSRVGGAFRCVSGPEPLKVPQPLVHRRATRTAHGAGIALHKFKVMD